MESLSTECPACTNSKFVIVMGSNLAGRHGKGLAKHCLQKHGAIYGQGTGLQGMSYAIPTKDGLIRTLPLIVIKSWIDHFIGFAFGAGNISGMKFAVSQIGCGLAGFQPKDIAPLFKDSPKNCYFDIAWADFLGYNHNYWN